MSWLPSFLSPATEPAAPPAPSVATVITPRQPHRQLLEYLMEPSRRQRVLYAVGGGVALLVGLSCASSVLATRASTRCPDGVQHARSGSAEDIEFGDPTEARFNMFVAKLYRTHEAALLKLTDDLEALGAARAAWTHTGKLPADLVAGPDATPVSSAKPREAQEEGAEAVVMVPATDADVAALDKKIRQVAIHADEVLTQYVCKLDGAPVKGSAELKQQRRDMIQASHLLGERIAPFLPSAQAATQTVEPEEEKETEAVARAGHDEVVHGEDSARALPAGVDATTSAPAAAPTAVEDAATAVPDPDEL